MDIEDDFIEDSGEDSTSSELFVTQTDANAAVALPPMDPLKPAVNVYPLTELTRQLLSAMQSLMYFGSSDIGATIPGSVYDLGRHLRVTCNSFPQFFIDTTKHSHTKEYKLLKQLDLIKSKRKRQKDINLKLRAYNRQLKSQFSNVSNINRIDSTDRNDAAARQRAAEAELRMVASSLRKTIIKLRASHEDTVNLQYDNTNLTNKIEKMYRKFKRKAKDDESGITDMKNTIIRGEMELVKSQTEHKANLEAAEALIKQMETPVQIYERRMEDLNQKITIYRKTQPKRGLPTRKQTFHQPPAGSKRSMMPPKRAHIAIPRVAFANTYR